MTCLDVLLFAKRMTQVKNGKRCEMTKTNSFSRVMKAAMPVCALALLFLFFGAVAAPPVMADPHTNATGLTDCPGTVGKVVQDSLNQGDRFARASGFNQLQDTYDETIRQASTQPTGPRESVKISMCLNDVLVYFDMMAGLMKAGKMLEKAIAGALAYFLNSVCTMVKDAILTTVQNALDLICIPLPNLGYSMSLPSVKRKSCSGYAPLRDMMQVDVVPGLDYSSRIPNEMMSSTLSRWIEPYNIKGNYSLRNGRF